ncbi:DUF4303 domain-containing protein [Xanthomonas maliensis]|uniref:DUF4303 domain-containing protein n=1 Tax=Xanthomonas maliensis TaxID=1321368 RepID=UPI001264D8A4|nr:DUF4303 domain-containing protein [Xanthomonas maliensis]KAB7764642.1 hypothetical protein CKY51_17455 [Xanthomonas maliensis]
MADGYLVDQIYKCAKSAFLGLFNEKKDESFYYCVLVTTEEGHPPFISAWSKQVLQREKDKGVEAVDYFDFVKWSYADSPYVDYSGQDFFELQSIFNARPSIDQLSRDAWLLELDVRVSSMEKVMAKLDAEGIFELNQPRSNVLINVELTPPSYSNTERALRLNNADNEALIAWLDEAAEKQE